MKRIASVFIAFVMIFALVGCDSAEDHIGEAKTPSGSGAMKGRQYQEVVEDFEEKGFTNIQLDKLEDLVTGWMTKDGEVEKVSVGGDEDYSPDKWVVNDAAVIITYHTFPEKKESSEPEESKSGESGSGEEPSSSSDGADDFKKSEILTSDNNDDLKKLLLLKSTSDPSISDFASKYQGRTIEFNGHIAYIDNHENSKTRYDILIYAGNYRESDLVGPHFKFEDVGVYDLGLKELYLPEFVSIGSNVRIVAEVEKFNSSSELFMLDPISITEIVNEASIDEGVTKASGQPETNSSVPPENSSKVAASTTTPVETNSNFNEERKIYWADTGTKIHASPSCRTIKGNINSGTEADAISAGRTEGYCKVCS